MRKSVLVIVGCLLTSLTMQAQQKVVSLNSADGKVVWQVAPQDGVAASGQEVSTAGFVFADGVEGIVPGVVFASYVAAGREENPDIADNIYRVDETKYSKPYWYRTEFEIPAGNGNDNGNSPLHYWLCFDNTNRYADFWFNGHKVSGTAESTKDVSGHMLRSRFDVTPYVNYGGKNAVAVLIYDADQKKTRKGEGPYGVACSPSYLAGAGWDWMPYVPGRLAGITGNCYVMRSGAAVMEDPWVRSYLPSLDRAELSFSTDVRNVSGEDKTFTVRGKILPEGIAFERQVRVRAGEKRNVQVSRSDVAALVVDHPRLWWPNGYGNPELYTCEVECLDGGTVTDRRSFRFGVKKYEYRIEKNVVDFPVLNIYCNGQRIFIKGGNWGMSEYLLRMHGRQYELPVRLHKEMNYNMIRLWTGCVTDDEFYDYCDEYGIMVWNDFWLYVAYNDVVEHDAFKTNARDKVRRLRNHPSIAAWCGANETRPVADIDQALRLIVMEEDAGDRLYTSCSNQDAKSGSGWWKDMPPRHHFETSASNLAFNEPSYPYGIDHGYGFRSEIGMATFPTFESVREFIPEKDWWPLPADEQLENDDETVWNKHFFGKEAWNGDPIDYKKSVNDRYGESKSLEEFCEKAQLINLEDMKGMYEAWNDKMWNDASALLIWMSHPAYPSFVWQTYDYYYDPTGCYWGARQACEPRHVQWNCLTNSVKVINATARPLENVSVTAHVYNIDGKELYTASTDKPLSVAASNIREAFVLQPPSPSPSGGGWEGAAPIQFIRLELRDAGGKLLSENFYWRNAENDLDYRPLLTLPEARLRATARKLSGDSLPHSLPHPLPHPLPQPLPLGGRSGGGWSGGGWAGLRLWEVTLTNPAKTVSFANRLRLIDGKTGKRILPAVMSDGYITLLPGEQRTVTIEVSSSETLAGVTPTLLIKQFGKKERKAIGL